MANISPMIEGVPLCAPARALYRTRDFNSADRSDIRLFNAPVYSAKHYAGCCLGQATIHRNATANTLAGRPN
jgi:hypothetical protein